MSSRLLHEVRGLLTKASAHYEAASDTEAGAEIAAAAGRLDGPLLVAFAGKVKAGKSTLLNALVGEELAPTDAGECTKVVSWYQHAIGYEVTVHPHEGPAFTTSFRRDNGSLHVDLGGLAPEAIERLVIGWPSASLHELTLIDTPGVESTSRDVAARTVEFLAPEDERATAADAVIYLMRHLHASDRRFLEAFHDQELSQATPVNTVGVLSRADEVGAGRIDAMTSARRIADRYRRDHQIKRLCQTVVPVAGLIAEAGATLRENDHRALAAIAAAPEADAERLLVSVDRFGRTEDAFGLSPIEREHLLDRFGVFGVRLAVDLIRRGSASSATGLAAELRSHSGIGELRTLLDTLFRQRRAVLKARAALLTARSVLLRFPAGTEGLVAELERIVAGAHEIAELRLLTGLRSGRVQFDADTNERLERVVGSAGTDPRHRLGLCAGATDDEVRTAAADTLREWRRAFEHPLTSLEQSEALQIAIGSVERIFVDVS